MPPMTSCTRSLMGLVWLWLLPLEGEPGQADTVDIALPAK